MVHKNKNHIETSSPVNNIYAAVGMFAMAAATTLGVVGHMQHDSHKVIAALEPVYAHSTAAHISEINSEELRRPGKEEIHHSSATYGAAKRSPSVSGAV